MGMDLIFVYEEGLFGDDFGFGVVKIVFYVVNNFGVCIVFVEFKNMYIEILIVGYV